MAAVMDRAMEDPVAAEADRLRAHAYTLLAHLLAAPPTPGLLSLIAAIRGDDTPLGQAFDDLAGLAGTMSAGSASREYHALFIGVTQGELLPYASAYRTGMLHDRPLAELRADLQALGIERAPGVAEPEDHIATLCEVMATLTAQTDVTVQRLFFARHLTPWADRFFADLETAQAADLYRPVGTIGRLFLTIDAEGFAMLEAEGFAILEESEP